MGEKVGHVLLGVAPRGVEVSGVCKRHPTAAFVAEVHAHAASLEDLDRWPVENLTPRLIAALDLDQDGDQAIQFLEAKPAEINQAGEFIDPWGSPYEIQVGDTVLIYSCGPNRIDDRGGNDDITHDASGPPAR